MKWFFAIIALFAIAIIISKIKNSGDPGSKSNQLASSMVGLHDKSKSDSAIRAEIKADSIAEAINKKERDSVAKILKPKFRISKDEFEEAAFVRHNTSPKYVNYNGVFFYFEKTADLASNLRLKIQYASDDWLFIEHYIFNIDGENVTVFPSNVERDHSSGDIYEWADISYGTNTGLFHKLKEAKVVKIKFSGKQYYDTKTLSNSQIKALKETFQYYKALGGKEYF